MAIGGDMMAQAVKVSVTDLAHYPTGELAGTVAYEKEDGSGAVIVGKVVARSDHARWFEEGASQHFVSIASVDWRVIDGLYENAIPVYEYNPSDESNYKPKDGYSGNTLFGQQSDRMPIGYLISSSPHPFMEEGFAATKDTVVREIANQIALATGG